jgi:hypothetical protein
MTTVMAGTKAEVRLQQRAVTLGRVILAVIAVASLIVIAGWGLNESPLKRVWIAPNAVPASTAISIFLFACFTLLHNLLPNRKQAKIANQVAAGLLLAGGLATLAESIMAADFGIAYPVGPQPEDSAGITFPGPMAPNISVEVILLSIAMLFPAFVIKGKPLGQTCAMVVLLASITAVLGHTLGVEFMCTMIGCIKIPIVSSALFAAACAGYVACHPRLGAMQLLCAPTAAGQLSRKLSAALLMVPLALAVRAIAVNSKIIDSNFGWFLFAGAMILMLWRTIGLSAQNIAAIDEEKTDVQRQLMDSSAAMAKLSLVASALQSKASGPKKLKKVCLTCAKSYDEEVEVCPADNDTLVQVADDSLEGNVFADRYMIDKFIGRGGMCSVYRAHHIYTEGVRSSSLLPPKAPYKRLSGSGEPLSF